MKRKFYIFILVTMLNVWNVADGQFLQNSCGSRYFCKNNANHFGETNTLLNATSGGFFTDGEINSPLGAKYLANNTFYHNDDFVYFLEAEFFTGSYGLSSTRLVFRRGASVNYSKTIKHYKYLWNYIGIEYGFFAGYSCALDLIDEGYIQYGFVIGVRRNRGRWSAFGRYLPFGFYEMYEKFDPYSVAFDAELGVSYYITKKTSLTLLYCYSKINGNCIGMSISFTLN